MTGGALLLADFAKWVSAVTVEEWGRGSVAFHGQRRKEDRAVAHVGLSH